MRASKDAHAYHGAHLMHARVDASRTNAVRVGQLGATIQHTTYNALRSQCAAHCSQAHRTLRARHGTQRPASHCQGHSATCEDDKQRRGEEDRVGSREEERRCTECAQVSSALPSVTQQRTQTDRTHRYSVVLMVLSGTVIRPTLARTPLIRRPCKLGGRWRLPGRRTALNGLPRSSLPKSVIRM
jgi:hypothetical protein